MRAELSELNRRLLTTLAEASGNILDNTALVQSLDETKAKATDIATALEASVQVKADLELKRSAYIGVAQVVASMFFVLADLRALNSMYCFSLAAFMRLFTSALQSAASSSELSLRLAAIVPVRCLLFRVVAALSCHHTVMFM